MKKSFILLSLLAACSTDDGSAVTWPFGGQIIANQAYSDTRGTVELFVKTNHPALIRDIVADGGAMLTQAYDLAGVPVQDRPTRTIQLASNSGLYQANPGALISALMAYGS